MKLLVSRIQRYSLHDGPGIRTTVFLQGCPLACKWCHNPETIPFSPVLQYFKSKCISCGACLSKCKNGALGISDGKITVAQNKCNAEKCGICADNCPSSALCVNGKMMDTDEILRTILRDREFYSDTGGVTISGGEPLLQADGTAELLKLCKENGINTAVDTAGFVLFESFEKVMEFTDLFLYDLKIMDSKKHEDYTGVNNELILNNFRKLYEAHKEIIVRVPVIPGVNTSAADIELLADFLKDFPRVEIPEFLRLHKMAVSKYESLGLENSFYEGHDIPDAEFINAISKMYKNFLKGCDGND